MGYGRCQRYTSNVHCQTIDSSYSVSFVTILTCVWYKPVTRLCAPAFVFIQCDTPLFVLVKTSALFAAFHVEHNQPSFGVNSISLRQSFITCTKSAIFTLPSLTPQPLHTVCQLSFVPYQRPLCLVHMTRSEYYM